MIGKFFSPPARSTEPAGPSAAPGLPPARLMPKKATGLAPLLQAGKAGDVNHLRAGLDVRPGSYFKQLVNEHERGLDDGSSDGSATVRPPQPVVQRMPQNDYADLVVFAKHKMRLDPVLRYQDSSDQDAVAWLRQAMPEFRSAFDRLDADTYAKLRREVDTAPAGTAPRAHQLLQATWLAHAAADANVRSDARAVLQHLGNRSAAPLAALGDALPTNAPKRLNPMARPEDVVENCFKLNSDPAEERQLRELLGYKKTPRVRFMWGEQGLFYVSSAADKGSFGKFRVTRHRDGTLFGIKEFRTEQALLHSPKKANAKTAITQLKDLLAEIELIRKLAPKVSLYGHMFWQGNFYLLMTPFKGSMVDAMDGLATKPEARRQAALLAIRNVADDLRHIHRKGFVHRDVKWDNVLFDSSGQPLLWDFGMAKKMNYHGMLRTKSMGGTYFPPETLYADEGNRVRWYATSDVFCLGVMLCQLFVTDEYPDPFRMGIDRDRRGSLRIVSVGGESPPYKSYGKWYERVTDGFDFVNLERLRRQVADEEHRNGHYGRFFAEMMRRDPLLAQLAIVTMLWPHPDDRRGADEIADVLDSNIEPTTSFSRGAQALQELPRGANQQRAIDAVDHVYRNHHSDRALTTAA